MSYLELLNALFPPMPFVDEDRVYTKLVKTIISNQERRIDDSVMQKDYSGVNLLIHNSGH
jgi:hypothetical protein